MVKSPTLAAAIVLGFSLVVSSYFLADGIRDFGESLRLRPVPSSPASIPSTFTIRFEGGNSPVRVEQTQK